MNDNQWLIELEEMCIRYAELGVLHDLTEMNDAERWGLYRFLKRYGIIHGAD